MTPYHQTCEAEGIFGRLVWFCSGTSAIKRVPFGTKMDEVIAEQNNSVFVPGPISVSTSSPNTRESRDGDRFCWCIREVERAGRRPRTTTSTTTVATLTRTVVVPQWVHEHACPRVGSPAGNSCPQLGVLNAMRWHLCEQVGVVSK